MRIQCHCLICLVCLHTAAYFDNVIRQCAAVTTNPVRTACLLAKWTIFSTQHVPAILNLSMVCSILGVQDNWLIGFADFGAATVVPFKN